MKRGTSHYLIDMPLLSDDKGGKKIDDGNPALQFTFSQHLQQPTAFAILSSPI